MSECKVKAQLKEAMKASMRNRDKARLATVRLALAELQRVEVDEKSIDDKRALAVLDKMVRQRRDAIVQFESAGRTDLADQEKVELAILKDFLPAQLSEAELIGLVNQAIAETGASSMRDMGKVMAMVKSEAHGRADMSAISAIVKSRLTG
ncbi:GatB/YqeY domain-containing protein [Candidatus Sororendozoicomonas aggregata]|uniref:GatB/YqeY domain-containing protein n=1 Tax=Candidatus Sororendozoicomonas aggregata TaxID=3073239 RepID=UPI002ED57152